MGKLIYCAITSLDGYIEDGKGNFDWAAPDAEVHAYVNDLERPVGTHLYGRRMYETMAIWQTIEAGPGVDPIEVDFAELWRSVDKVVYSRTLEDVGTPRTRLERELDPEALRRLKDSTDHDLSVGGSELAAHTFRAGLVDRVDLFVCPVSVGGGKPALPHDLRLDLALTHEQRFGNGTVHLQYTVA
jgi:dihydrofolate reductase